MRFSSQKKIDDVKSWVSIAMLLAILLGLVLLVLLLSFFFPGFRTAFLSRIVVGVLIVWTCARRCKRRLMDEQAKPSKPINNDDKAN